jgi:uncharacterized protein YprB with RNaseH-like and TPR domain
VAEDTIERLVQEAYRQGFAIDIPPAKNLTRALQSRNGCTFDIETTGLRENPNAHLVSACIGLSKADPMEFWVEDPQQEADILRQLADVLMDKDLIITWNGDRFDIPFLNHRLQIHQIPFQIQTAQSLDLFRIAEKMKAAGLIPAAGLQVVERFYGIVRPDQLPGRYVPGRYADYLDSRDPLIKQEILQHNREDVLFLLMLSPFIYQGTVPADESTQTKEELQLLDQYLMHMERIEKMLEEKVELEQMILQLAGTSGQTVFVRPYGNIVLQEAACTVQKKQVNAPPIRTFEELEEFYRNTLANLPKRTWNAVE